jgi:hypothetical protein
MTAFPEFATAADITRLLWVKHYRNTMSPLRPFLPQSRT